MNKIDLANVKKTLYYLHRNGFKNTCYAVWERLEERKQPPYHWIPPTPEELTRQRQESSRLISAAVTFSIVVPCYRTKDRHLREMMDSVRSQTYPYWELILADATEDDSVERVVQTVKDRRVRYVKLEKNAGIAENTNQGIKLATGMYVGLLDHDDLLTRNALYEIWKAIEDAAARGVEPKLLYSDEDKCDSNAIRYFDLNKKEDFNLDLLLSNNYICHFMVLERELIQNLLLRKKYDGAQDYDLVLRAAEHLTGQEDKILHIPKVLYHWRCHSLSTAENSQSKLYAYDAGRRAVQEFADRRGWRLKAVDTLHLGFYRLEYPRSPLDVRSDVGAVGGPLYGRRRKKTLHYKVQGSSVYVSYKVPFCRRRILSGRLKEDGTVYYKGLPKGFSGYFHRASLSQDAEAVDIRNIRLREELWPLFCDVVGVPWRTIPGGEIFDVSTLPKGTDIKATSVELGRAIRRAGYRILYLPECAQEYE